MIVPKGFAFLIAVAYCSATDSSGGWTTDPSDVVAFDGKCNIEVYDYAALSEDEFLQRFAYSEPVIITNYRNNEKFRSIAKKADLVKNYGDRDVLLASANTYSYTKVPSTLGDYVKNILKAQKVETPGNETLYLFGDLNPTVWSDLLSQYNKPPYNLPKHDGALSFGIAGSGTGVPFHFHGPGFGEIIYGHKRWFFYPPDDKPKFDPDQTTLKWFLEEYPKLPRDKLPLECVLGPNQLIYFPDRWWHGTLNCETSVFVSTFLGPSPGSH